MAAPPRYVEPDSGVDPGLAFRRSNAAPGFPEHVIRREAFAREFVQLRLDMLVVTEKVVIEVERLLERKLAQNRFLKAIEVPEPNAGSQDVVICDELDEVGMGRHLRVGHFG